MRCYLRYAHPSILTCSIVHRASLFECRTSITTYHGLITATLTPGQGSVKPGQSVLAADGDFEAGQRFFSTKQGQCSFQHATAIPRHSLTPQCHTPPTHSGGPQLSMKRHHSTTLSPQRRSPEMSRSACTTKTDSSPGQANPSQV